MKNILSFGFLKRSLQMFLSISLVAIWLLSTGSLTYASSVKQQASTSTCQSSPTNFTIPANFDLLHASTEELHQHFLPSRPSASKPQDVAHWLQLVKSIKKVVCIPSGGSPLTYHGRPVIAAPGASSAVSCNTPPSGTKCYYNWNGYIVGNGTQPGFNDIYGQWNIACVNTAKSPSSSKVVSWVGLGGNFSENLWQAGSGWNPSDGYYLWYEALDSSGNTGTAGITPIKVNNVEIHPKCGTSVYTEVYFAPNAPTTKVSGFIINNNVEYPFSAPQQFRSGNLSAEWIDERPACDNFNDFFQLADYNYSQWIYANASPNNASAGYSPIGSFAHTRVWMVDYDGTPIAWTDFLGSNTSSGTDNYKTYWIGNGTNLCS